MTSSYRAAGATRDRTPHVTRPFSAINTDEIKMKINKLIPTLYTNEIQKTVDFYVQLLNFQCKSYEPNIGWASLQLDNIEIMVTLPNDHLPFEKPLFTGSFYLKTDIIDKIWGQIKDKVEIAYPIENFEYGMREFAIYDNNGYMIQFGEEINDM